MGNERYVNVKLFIVILSVTSLSRGNKGLTQGHYMVFYVDDAREFIFQYLESGWKTRLQLGIIPYLQVLSTFLFSQGSNTMRHATKKKTCRRACSHNGFLTQNWTWIQRPIRVNNRLQIGVPFI